MKKLISLLAAISVVSACSIGAFAATDFTVNGETGFAATDVENPATYEKGENGLYNVDLTEVAGDQDQTTILAVKGNNIAVGSIQYIGQSADKTFSFDLKDNLTEQVNVLAGGSKISPTLVGSMKGAQTQTGYTISGAVENFVSQDFIDELAGYVTDLYGEEQVATFNESYTTTAYLLDTESVADYIAYYQDEADEFSYIKSSTVSFTDGSFSFADVESGKYALVISRPSALPYMEYVTVDGSNVKLDTISLVMGDLSGTMDFLIDPSDVASMVDAISEIGEDNFIASYDIEPDYLIDPSDVAAIVSNAGSDITIYDTELINENF